MRGEVNIGEDAKIGQLQTCTLKVTGTQSHTLKCGPMRMVWSGRTDGGDLIITGRRKPLLRWWFELVGWHLWRRWRKVRIVIR